MGSSSVGKDWPSIVARLRQAHQLTQAEFGELLARDSQTVSRWERGVTSPPQKTKRQIIDLFQQGFGVSHLQHLLQHSPLLTRIAEYDQPHMTVAATPRYAEMHHRATQEVYGWDIRASQSLDAWTNIDELMKHPAIQDGSACLFSATAAMGDQHLHHIYGTMIQQETGSKLWRIDYSEVVKATPCRPKVWSLDEI